jgi:DNA polymerase-1
MVIIDAFNMIYRAAGVASVKPEREYLYNSLHKTFLQIFFKMFNRIYREHKHEKIVIAWENDGKTFRNEIYPEYKNNRKGNLKDIVENAFGDILEGLSYYGCIILKHEKAEGDDIIYSICKNSPEEKILVISGDKDFTQLLKFNNVRVFSPNTQKFVEKPCYDYIKARAIEGDPSDNIVGLKGIGPKRAKSILNNYETFWNCLSEQNKKLIMLNEALMDLSKHPDSKEIDEYVVNSLKEDKSLFSYEKIKEFVRKNRLVEIFSSLSSELGAF